MACPINENQLLDYLEEQCPEDGKAAVRAHLDSCSRCRELYESLQRVRSRITALAQESPRQLSAPPESFWEESARAVALATYGKSWGAVEPLFKRYRLHRLAPALMAAAAVLLLALVGVFEWAPLARFSGPGPALVSQNGSDELYRLAENDLVDSLFTAMAEEIVAAQQESGVESPQYFSSILSPSRLVLADQTLSDESFALLQKSLNDRLFESVEEETARVIQDRDYIGLNYSVPFLSSGRTFHEALQELDDQELDEVYASLVQL